MNRPNTKKTDTVIIIVLLLIAAAIAFAVLGRKNEKSAPVTEDREVTAADYNAKDKTIGILSGTNMEQAAFDFFPDSEYLYFKNYADLNTALLNGAIDAYLGDEPALKSIRAKEPRVDFIKKRLTDQNIAFAFRKNDADEAALCRQFNEFLAKANAEGLISELDAVWFGNDESKKVVDMSGLTGENGTVHVVTTTTDEPYSYIKDNRNVGYDIDVTVRFCREYGYALELGDVDYPARIPAIASGKYEFTTSMNVTPEREEEVLFSDPVSTGGIVVAVRAEDLSSSDTDNEPKVSDYDGKNIGILTGSSFEPITLETFPGSKYYYFNLTGDMTAALQNRKIDLFIEDEPAARLIASQQPDITYIKKNILDEDYSFAFSKSADPEILRQFNEYLAEYKADGRLSALADKWLGNDEAAKTAVRQRSSGENGKLKIVCVPNLQPFTYIKDNELVGYAVELITGFADRYGCEAVFEQNTVAGAIAGITSGRYDVLAGTVSVTEERKQSMDFSDTVYSGGMTAVIRAEDVTGIAASEEDSSFWEEMKESFEKNFIREDRWRLIVQGIGTTCLITVISALFGSVLAFLVCMFRRTGSRLANTISNIYVRLLQGTPMVVLLMILYYIVFGRSGISAVWVAVIGFTLNFGAYVSEILRSGIDSIDGGQREAAIALGYTENRAFFKFVFPQAALRQLPVYRGEIVSLLKSTSIVGYIAIQDLTKMSDIIRSRTYEAFFPLIVTAVIYFILAWLLTLLMKLLLRRMDPKRRRQGAKEVQ